MTKLADYRKFYIDGAWVDPVVKGKSTPVVKIDRGGKLTWREDQAAFVPDPARPKISGDTDPTLLRGAIDRGELAPDTSVRATVGLLSPG